MDARLGLTRRYSLEGILEAHGGKAKITPLNYDALRILRDPLYVKMGQELRDESKAQTARVIADQDFLNALKGLASQQGVPRDQLVPDNMNDPPGVKGWRRLFSCCRRRFRRPPRANPSVH